MLEFFSPDEEATARLAAQIASRAQSGDMFALYGTLGMGKSVFARAFIQALTAPEFEIYHYDLYRLKSPEEVFELNIEEAIYGGVCLIEWPEKMGGYLPRQALKINIAPENNGRRLTLDCADNRRLSRFNDVKAGND